MKIKNGEPEISPLCFFKWCTRRYEVRRVLKELRLSQIGYLCRELHCGVLGLCDAICEKQGITETDPLAGSCLFY